MKVLAVSSVDNRGISFPFKKAGQFTADGIPVGNDVTSDLAIRKAVDIAVDRQALVDGILSGTAARLTPSVTGFPGGTKTRCLKTAGSKKQHRFLQKQDGWMKTRMEFLRRMESKAEFNLVYPAGDSIRQSLALAVSDQMAPLGIKINLAGLSWDEIEARMYSDAVLFGWGSHDPLEMYNLYHSSTAGTGYYNTTYYQNPTADGYMESALRASTEEEALE